MKKVLRVIGIVLLALVILATAFVFLYRHFVTNQIMDRGGMENPFLESEWEEETQTDPEALPDPGADAESKNEGT